MTLSLRRRSAPAPAGSAPSTGLARVDVRTKRLTKRLRPGEVAVIDHEDLDKVSADALLACRPAAVVNAARSISGRYPNQGPAVLLEAGIPIVDHCGADLMTRVGEGVPVSLVGGAVNVGGVLVASGTRLTLEGVHAAMDEARAGLSDQIEAFATNTIDYLRRERDLLIDGIGFPDIATQIEGRHVLVVVRGYHYREDLAMLRSYIREYKPVLVGVDGGADALVEEGHQPHLIVGDMDSISDSTLLGGAEVVVHAYRDGRAPGLERVRALGLEPVVFPATGTSEDVALLLADEGGAELIVAVGTHATLEEFLDKGRSGMASTFLTRLRVGGKLVDAKGVSRLYRARIGGRSLGMLVVAAGGALLAALSATPGGRAILQVAAARWDDVWSWLQGLMT